MSQNVDKDFQNRTEPVGPYKSLLLSTYFCGNTLGNRMDQGNKANKQKFHHIFGTKSSIVKTRQKDIFLRNSTKSQE